MDTFLTQAQNLFQNEEAYLSFLTEHMVICVVLFVAGLLLIMFGGDRFVDSSIVISKKMGIPQIIVGATIVSLGTTLPEILTSTTAAFSGQGDMAVGNAFGSIVCNAALIAAVTLLWRPTKGIEKKDISWRSLLFFVAYGLVAVVGLCCGVLPRWIGIVLLLAFGVYAFLSIKGSGSEDGEAEEDSAEEGKEASLAAAIVIMIVCAALLFLGSKFLVSGGQVIAAAVGVPSGVIAVTFVALGTSLPELVTAISALIKGYSDVSLGNVIGANTLNLLLVLGIPATITGITIQQKTAFYLSAPVGLLVMLLLIVPFWVKRRGYRWQGALLLAVYLAYCVLEFLLA